MTLDRAWPLEQTVFARVTASAASGTPVFNYVPTKPPVRYIRIDGFAAHDVTRWKTNDKFRHSFMVHAFDQMGAKTGAWVAQQIAAIHAAIIATPLDADGQRVQVEAYNSAFDKDAVGGHTAHAFTRYSLQIGK